MSRLDELFKINVSEGIEQLHKDRKERPEAPKGKHYVRNWYDRMSEKSTLSTDYFIKHIHDIWAKKSNLPSEERKIINYVCATAYLKALQQFSIEESEKKSNQPTK
jgi:hypothetical protein